MPRTLAIAAGGGGDAITACVLARKLGDFAPAIMSYSWDRLLVDPLPGPRGRPDFTGLRSLRAHVWEVLADTDPVPPAGSTLPQLAGSIPCRLLLLDPYGGAAGMADQIAAAAEHFDADRLAVIDVGGDAVAEGHEHGLRSPLADFLALAAATRTTLPVRLFVTGIPLDSELTEAEVLARLDQLDATEVGQVASNDLAGVRSVFEWHPSEANGLLAAAARGIRGTVQARDSGGRVTLTDTSTRVYVVDGQQAVQASAARSLVDTTNLDEVEARVRQFHGTSEIDYERRKAARRSTNGPATQLSADDLAKVDDTAAAVAATGADFLTIRRLAELVGATDPSAIAQLRQLLADHRAERYDPPLYRAGVQ